MSARVIPSFRLLHYGDEQIHGSGDLPRKKKKIALFYDRPLRSAIVKCECEKDKGGEGKEKSGG